MILYKKDNKGKIRVWSIMANPEGMTVNYGQMGGAMTAKHVPVYTNQSGRSFGAQVDLEMNQRISEQMDKGYVISLEEAKEGKATNSLDLPLPMLAQPIKSMRPNSDWYYMQYKYDGMRCLIHNGPSGLTAYSRKSQPIETIRHIKNQLKLPEGVTVDGELYAHGQPLQNIMSWVKRFQHDTLYLHYVIYDIVSDKGYVDRLKMIKEIENNSGEQVKAAPTKVLDDRSRLSMHMVEAKGLGYEGLILRDPWVGYETGKRSQSLVKVKTVEDDEFLIHDIKESKDGHAILCCDGFSVIAPGTHEYKRYIYQHPNEFIGRHVRVEYANKTKDGVPFHPVATNISD